MFLVKIYLKKKKLLSKNTTYIKYCYNKRIYLLRS